MAPAGNPETVTLTGLANPFWPTTETVKLVLELSTSAVIVAGDSTMPKSLGGGGGEEGAEPPHPTRLPSHRKTQAYPKARYSVADGTRIIQLQVCTFGSGALGSRASIL